MVFSLDILDDDLRYLDSVIRDGGFTLNRYAKHDYEKVKRLVRDGLIMQKEYYGEQMCYHPSFSLTDFGMRVYGLWKDSCAAAGRNG